MDLPTRIDYDHDANPHTTAGAQSALAVLLEEIGPVRSVLDAGCGRGTWLRAALGLGATSVVGLDGVAIPEPELLFPATSFRTQNLEHPWDIGRRFDLAICVEVAEHLSAEAGAILVDCLTKHADLILFSAAAPDQSGQHHVHCQWPGYWQRVFNARGYACDDWPRWKIWDLSSVEPWYRQNLFAA